MYGEKQYSEYEVERIKNTEGNLGIFFGFIVTFTVMLVIMFLVISINVDNYRLYEKRLTSTFVHRIHLTVDERKDLEKALVAWSMKDYTKLESWLKDLQKKGKYGILPSLPNGYDTDNNDIVYVVKAGKRILLPSAK